MEIAIRKSLQLKNHKDPKRDMQLCDNIEETMAFLEVLPKVPNRYNISFVSLSLCNEKLLPSVIQGPTLELKNLLKNLKYIFLSEKDKLSIIYF